MMMWRGAAIVLGLMFASLQWRLWVGDGGVAHSHRLRQQVEDARAENDRLRTRNEALDAEVLDLKSGHAAIEARARMSMGMIKSKETFFLVVESRS